MQAMSEASSPDSEPSALDLAAELQKVRDGDRDMLAAMVQRYYPRLRRMVHRRLELDFRRSNNWMSSAFSTSDIVQNVFLRVLSTMCEMRATDEASLLSYLAAVVHNHLLDALRYHRADKRDARRDAKSSSAVLEAIHKPDPDPQPSVAAARHEHEIALREVLSTVSNKQRELWELRAEDHRPFAEIAKRLGYASDAAARMAFHDLKARLLVSLKRRGFRYPSDETSS